MRWVKCRSCAASVDSSGRESGRYQPRGEDDSKGKAAADHDRAVANRRVVAELSSFVQRTGIPFFNTQMGKGAVHSLPLRITWGRAPSAGDYVHRAVDSAIHHSMDMTRSKSQSVLMTSGGMQVIHIGYTPANVEEVFFPHAEVVGDIGPSLKLLADQLEGKLKLDPAFLALREEILGRITEGADDDRFPVIPQRLVADVRKAMPEDGIVCLDNGMYKIWFARNYRTHVANTLLLDNALATMGAGLPSAMMAAMLFPKRRVLAVCGDGGFMMNSQEMETAVRLKLNLVGWCSTIGLRNDSLEAGGRQVSGLTASL